MSNVSFQDRALTLAEQLLRIPSVIEQEAEIAAWVQQSCRDAGVHAVARAENSLAITPRPLRDGVPLLMLVGHLDTVPELSPNEVRIEDGKLYGLGASDMKAADAVLLAAVERAVHEAPVVDLVGVLYSREEGPFDGNELPALRAAVPDLFDRAGLAVCMEPTDGRVEVGCLGTSHARVTFSGKRAHSARPWQGDNAIHKAAGLLQRLAALEPVDHTFDGFVFREVLNATMTEFRGARNVIPDRFTVNVNYRFAPGMDEAAVRRRLDILVEGLPDCSYELVDYCPAGRVCTDNELLDGLRRAAGDPEVTAKQAWTDVGRLSTWGVDAVNWGPGATAQAHQAGEWVEVEAVRESASAVDRWLWPDQP